MGKSIIIKKANFFNNAIWDYEKEGSLNGKQFAISTGINLFDKQAYKVYAKVKNIDFGVDSLAANLLYGSGLAFQLSSSTGDGNAIISLGRNIVVLQKNSNNEYSVIIHKIGNHVKIKDLIANKESEFDIDQSADSDSQNTELLIGGANTKGTSFNCKCESYEVKIEL